jgi:hypothetical protein
MYLFCSRNQGEYYALIQGVKLRQQSGDSGTPYYRTGVA